MTCRTNRRKYSLSEFGSQYSDDWTKDGVCCDIPSLSTCAEVAVLYKCTTSFISTSQQVHGVSIQCSANLVESMVVKIRWCDFSIASRFEFVTLRRFMTCQGYTYRRGEFACGSSDNRPLVTVHKMRTHIRSYKRLHRKL